MSASGNEPIISILHHHRLSWDKTSSLHQPLAELHFSRSFAAAIVASVPLIPPSSSWPRSSWFTGFHAGAEGFLYGCNLKNAIRIICSCFPLQVFKDLRVTSCQISEACQHWNSGACGQRTNLNHGWTLLRGLAHSGGSALDHSHHCWRIVVASKSWIDEGLKAAALCNLWNQGSSLQKQSHRNEPSGWAQKTSSCYRCQ